MKKALPAPQVNGGSRFLPIAAADKYTEGATAACAIAPMLPVIKARPCSRDALCFAFGLLQPKTTSMASSGRKMPCISYLLKPP